MFVWKRKTEEKSFPLYLSIGVVVPQSSATGVAAFNSLINKRSKRITTCPSGWVSFGFIEVGTYNLIKIEIHEKKKTTTI